MNILNLKSQFFSQLKNINETKNIIIPFLLKINKNKNRKRNQTGGLIFYFFTFF